MNAQTLKEAARSFGADLIGVAPIGKFANLPQENNPLAIFPQAKSMIVVGRRIPRGAMRALEANEKNNSTYTNFSLYFLEDNFLAKTTYDVTIWVEAQGFEAVPMFGYDTECTKKYPLGAPVEPNKPAPNVYVDWKFAAQAAGLGEIGKNGLFITPEYGPLQRFAMLLSDFEFEPDQVITPNFCKDCNDCINECRLAVLSEATHDYAICTKCSSGEIQTGFGRFETIDRIGAACGRACLASLERRGLLKNKFNNPFRNTVPVGAI